MAGVIVVDYGMGNVHSVAKAIRHVLDKKSKVKISNSVKDIKNATHIIFPGQGAVSQSMSSLKENFDIKEFKELICDKPFLGICMGLQVLMTVSDENNGTDCLNIIDGKVLSFKDNLKHKLKVPHMGWSSVKQEIEHPVWDNIDDLSYFYFVHSYFIKPTSSEAILSTTKYGLEFVSSIASNNIIAVQFHPEKSSRVGLNFLENFIKWRGN